jgi:hypothetical protein
MSWMYCDMVKFAATIARSELLTILFHTPERSGDHVKVQSPPTRPCVGVWTVGDASVAPRRRLKDRAVTMKRIVMARVEIDLNGKSGSLTVRSGGEGSESLDLRNSKVALTKGLASSTALEPERRERGGLGQHPARPLRLYRQARALSCADGSK